MSDEAITIPVKESVTNTNNTTAYNTWYPNGTSVSDNFTWYSTHYVYLYQIKCPKRSCKANNWLELDKITPCNTCGSKLKAVSNVPDYEIPITT